MSEIQELKQRVEAAEQHFGQVDEQHRKYSERLLDLMKSIEEGHGQWQAEVDQHRREVERVRGENEQLRSMLHSLLQAVDTGSRDRLCDTMRELDSKVSAIVGQTPLKFADKHVSKRAAAVEQDGPSGGPVAHQILGKAPAQAGFAGQATDAKPAQEKATARVDDKPADASSTSDDKPDGTVAIPPRSLTDLFPAKEKAADGQGKTPLAALLGEAEDEAIDAAEDKPVVDDIIQRVTRMTRGFGSGRSAAAS